MDKQSDLAMSQLDTRMFNLSIEMPTAAADFSEDLAHKMEQQLSLDDSEPPYLSLGESAATYLSLGESAATHLSNNLSPHFTTSTETSLEQQQQQADLQGDFETFEEIGVEFCATFTAHSTTIIKARKKAKLARRNLRKDFVISVHTSAKHPPVRAILRDAEVNRMSREVHVGSGGNDRWWAENSGSMLSWPTSAELAESAQHDRLNRSRHGPAGYRDVVRARRMSVAAARGLQKRRVRFCSHANGA